MSITPVAKPFLPKIDKYQEYIQKIWNSQHITNHGPLVKKLESELQSYLHTPNLFFVSNGTIALQIAIKALNLQGEVITTPFSYVATTSSIVWEGCKPVFVDIDANSLNIDPTKIEAAITNKTTAIIATHVYGNPCDIESINKIAKKHDLKVIYDAAHCFGVEYNNKSISSYGDISIFSFHATKLFHTVEGGAIVVNTDDYKNTVSYMRNFGHDGQEDFFGLGINGKNSEFHAAMGLCNLPEIHTLIAERKKLSELYDKSLGDSTKIQRPIIRKNTKYNYSYYPVLFEDEQVVLKVCKLLNSHNIFPRRYFYPILSKLNYVDDVNMPLAESVSKRILCLPLYNDLAYENVELICRLINDELK
ncbi:DegT/DnrJ/EryC1/StrS family aminotransferase [Rickettsiaceae bacterium]|nr:DegT/DnrJ/EryC1/StrS family aminotransferase [Rickettsiaceae bacterium]